MSRPQALAQRVWLVAGGLAVFAPLLLGFLFAPVGWLGLRHQDKLKAALAKGDAEPLDLA